jgi:alkanesulfonate monooxygenase SsuD/methylene tetrahydromethanopterin reductase-like flavin-dependent oxidoreductase (luciferase family)
MRFTLHQSASCPSGESLERRYHELIEEAVLAEEVGFDTYSLAEQHFNKEGLTQVSSPEVVFGAVAARTKRIRLRFTSGVLLAFNHPIRMAERLATLDLLSHGRAEMSTARSNHAATLAAFQIPPGETRAQWAESLEVMIAALTNDPFEHHGTFWDIPPTHLVPQAVQKPHPPLFYTATSIDGLRTAAAKGLGAVAGNSLPGGWEYVQACGDAYKSAIVNAQPVAAYVNDYLAAAAVVGYCAESDDVARQVAAEQIVGWTDLVGRMMKDLAPQSPEYAYMHDIDKIADRKTDVDFLVERAPYFSVGAPEFLIERFKRLEAIGYDEVWLRVDGFGHTRNLEAIEMFGKHVLPACRSDEPSVAGAPA